MYDNDSFSKRLGMKLMKIELGTCSLSMTINETMTNGFGIAHGSITYGLADSCLAFASNSHGFHALSIDTSINHLKPCNVGDIIIATAIEINITKKTALYIVDILNQNNEKVAFFKGMVHRMEKEW